MKRYMWKRNNTDGKNYTIEKNAKGCYQRPKKEYWDNIKYQIRELRFNKKIEKRG